MGFNEANTSQMSVLLTGNSSVQTFTSNCQTEGCPVDVEFWCDNGCGPRHFYWSCGMQNAAGKCWNVTGDASVGVIRGKARQFLDVKIEGIDQRTSLAIGSADEVDRFNALVLTGEPPIPYVAGAKPTCGPNAA